ncbi:hypothetical protein ERX37_04875 [Macrococcus hajekii]|uniref:TscT toxin domain-containing protein n=1 Tax=Macrococcus hajekii TaxID=198482 RepID=A0A4R6BNI1_9STAP|nr:DUF1474 family protein [Macrococcus hajekii]TDM03420.1 hypothetical protein ERX37_04875 [Macrococcus hajekii]GGA98722.1 hypothetical protein GCM10007190_03400 [Macrococcus hajekii]
MKQSLFFNLDNEVNKLSIIQERLADLGQLNNWFMEDYYSYTSMDAECRDMHARSYSEQRIKLDQQFYLMEKYQEELKEVYVNLDKFLTEARDKGELKND